MKLISTGCPNCLALKGRIDRKNIKYEYIYLSSEEAISLGYKSMPILEVDGEKLDYIKAVMYINKL